MKNLTLIVSLLFVLALVGCSKDVEFCPHEEEMLQEEDAMTIRHHGDFDALLDIDDKSDEFSQPDDTPDPEGGEDGITDDDDDDDDDELEDEIRE